jgi:putative hydrolase of the HAD superfamily
MKSERCTVRAVLFDLNETLTDREQSLSRFAHAFVEHFAPDLYAVDIDTVDQVIRRADGGGYRARDEVFAELLGTLPWKIIPDVTTLQTYWQAVFPLCTSPMPGMDLVLNTLQDMGLRLGVITNGGATIQSLKIDALGVRQAMSTILISEEIGIAKPDDRIFRLALAQLSLEPSDAVYVGDHPIVDVLGASAAGLRAVWLRRRIPWPEEHPAPALQIDALPGLIPLIHALQTDHKPSA